jgi:hypothetical protein
LSSLNPSEWAVQGQPPAHPVLMRAIGRNGKVDVSGLEANQ